MGRPTWAALATLGALVLTAPARAQDAIAVEAVELDPPTVRSLGVRVRIGGDDDRDARVDVRYRSSSEGSWKPAPPLFRVEPETVTGHTVPAQFAGSVLDLRPDTSYEIELAVTDPDGGDETRTVTATTRPIPRSEPASARTVTVTNADELQSALADAAPGDVITLQDGTYEGSFLLNASGTADDPIVLRGASRDGAVLDGAGCGGCNVLEVYGSHVHIERLTIRNAVRGLRFYGENEGNVVRRVRITDVDHGIGSQPGQSGFYICDNVVEGRLEWPLVYSDDGGENADLQGIRVEGDGHVVCHNDISGFGDPLLNFTDGYRAVDFYGNDVHEIYGDGIELDRAEGNVRCFHNRWTNVYTAISIQPALGGPVYVLRNLVANVADEQIKMKMTGSEPSGVLLYHNTFVSPATALNLQTPITQHNFRIENNLFVGPETTERGYTVDWTARIDGGLFDYNGYYPDGRFWFGKDLDDNNQLWDSFAEVMAAGVYEENGTLVSADVFASGFRPPETYTTAVDPPDLTPAEGAAAVDAARPIAGINDVHRGAGPDMGALERGCDHVPFGPRPSGFDESRARLDCVTDPGPREDGGVAPPDAGSGPDGGPATDGGTAGSDGGTADGGGGGCGCRTSRDADATSAGLLMLVVASGWARRRRVRGR